MPPLDLGLLLPRLLPLLDLAYVASPCKANWDEMVGDHRKRFCHDCHKHVYNVSEMSFEEAEVFLRQANGDACVRLYRRKDGTVMTNDCPVGVRTKRIRRAVGTVVGTGLAAAGLVTLHYEIKDRIEVIPFARRVKAPQAPKLSPVSAAMGWLGPTEPIPQLGERDERLRTIPQILSPRFHSGPTKPRNPDRIQGTALVRCTITTEGKTSDCTILKAPVVLHDQLLAMVAQQQYEPAQYKGKAIERKGYIIKVKLE